MKVVFYVAGLKPRELEIAEAVGAGIAGSGDRFEVSAAADFVEPSDAELACVFALKGHAKRILQAYRAIGARTLLFDKGLLRASTGMGAPMGYWRVSLDEFMPFGRMMRQQWPASRWIELGVIPHSRSEAKRAAAPVIYAGSSQKYCDFHDLGDATEYARDIIGRMRKQLPGKRGGRPIIYRPKPSWPDAVPIDHTIFSRPPETLGHLLKSAHALVTHGSHAAIDAIIAGVPAIVLGPGAARPVASTNLTALGTPEMPFPSHRERAAWLCAIAWWQWRISEMADGSMWNFLRDEMEKPAA
jgi:hypothetical protein